MYNKVKVVSIVTGFFVVVKTQCAQSAVLWVSVVIWVFTFDAVVGILSGFVYVTILSVHVHTLKAPTLRLSQYYYVSLLVLNQTLERSGTKTMPLPTFLTVQAVMLPIKILYNVNPVDFGPDYV